jgi:hypothetical protein
MNIYLHLAIHFILSLIPGYIAWKIWHKPIPAIIAGVMGGFFIDLDHVIEYFIVFGLHFNYNYFIKGYQFVKSENAYLIFHAWEYVPLLLLLAIFFKNKVFKTILFALAVGIFIHLCSDVILNKLPISFYSLNYRYIAGFHAEKILSGEDYARLMKDKAEIDKNLIIK